MYYTCTYILHDSGYYFSGDGALRDGENHYRITGRVDDMINSKGHRLGTAEIECAMVRGRGAFHMVSFFAEVKISRFWLKTMDYKGFLPKSR